MSGNDLLFAVVPYVVLALAIIVTIVRFRQAQFTVSSLSSQLLESKKLYWGSISFHWGLSLVLVGHLLALLVPSGFELWNGAPLRLYLLEFTGVALGLWAAAGLIVLVIRRSTEPRVRRVTTPMDTVVMAIIGVQIFTGLWTAIAHRWGSFWGTEVMVPYVRSLLRFSPEPGFIDPLPFMVKVHVLAFFAFLAVFPFTRLVHIITLPLQYLTRPWQKVVSVRDEPPAEYVTRDKNARGVS
ncbi:MAG: respiratory nitrate reductase subunit gamma [Actinomycetia bacterium]|nr:respiratory nitrate reductase subunit gamma [Actinomycetes bacterium]